ncbi:MAG: hypothetical protein R2690_06815 [Acidimicrobiales bacterium]
MWRPEVNGWDEYIGWAKRLYEWPGFDAMERDWLLAVADRLAARAAFRRRI